MDEITTNEMREIIKMDPLVILPIGATEAHGIHLPLGTDTFQAARVADDMAERMDNVLIAPALPYGIHSSMRNLAGTINITFDSMRSFVRDILDSFARHGIRRILIVSGHAASSHMTAITEACRSVVSEHDVKIMFVSDYRIVEEREDFRFEGDGHGGVIETSRMLAIDPDIVGSERPKGVFIDSDCVVLRDASSCMPDGIAGDTSKASAELGERMNNYIVETLIGMVEREMR
ncbi:MAG: creatininase family protein [Methanomassiliicoccaceae archaeon]|nr:creatininase family protein [Methanomassiliicoccaceae archaeon]